MREKPEFSFELYQRNQTLGADHGIATPLAMSTGTTIVGLMYKDGVVLGADTRATEGSIVADKNCSKIHYLASNLYCGGAGTAADTEFTTSLIRSTLELHRLNSGRSVRAATAVTLMKQRLFQYRGQIGAALVVGGVDCDGPQLYAVYPHGSTDKLPFITMGSGSLAAMSVFESKYPGMEMGRSDAMSLVAEAVSAGILNDLGSGSYVDMVVISKTQGTEVFRSAVRPNEPAVKMRSYVYPRGSAVILDEQTVDF